MTPSLSERVRAQAHYAIENRANAAELIAIAQRLDEIAASMRDESTRYKQGDVSGHIVRMWAAELSSEGL